MAAWQCARHPNSRIGGRPNARTGDRRFCCRAYELEFQRQLPDEHAVALGRKGGSATSKAKTKAARENGKRGGRPKGS